MVQQVTDTNFDAEVLQATGPVLVDFYADWCGPCKSLAPHLEAVANENKAVKIVKMNIDENPMVPSQNNVRSIPTLIVFKDGKPVATKMGAMAKSALEAWINEAVAK